jgi:hypothetical protein
MRSAGQPAQPEPGEHRPQPRLHRRHDELGFGSPCQLDLTDPAPMPAASVEHLHVQQVSDQQQVPARIGVAGRQRCRRPQLQASAADDHARHHRRR